MSVMQFKEVALIGTDGSYVKFSPFVEGVEGASRTLLVTENNEEVKIEDDQTVFTSIKNTITIVAPVLDSQIAILNTWVANDVYVGFAGYTIGGIGYAPALTNDVAVPAFQLPLRVNGTNAGSIFASRGDAFQVSSIQRVDDIKHTFRIVLTQICLQGKNASTGLKYGLQTSNNLLETSVSRTYGASMSTTTLLPMHGNGSTSSGSFPVLSATGNGFGLNIQSNLGVGRMLNSMFFPFSGTRVVFSIDGTQTASFNAAADAVRFFVLASDGSTIDSGLIPNSTTYTNASLSFTLASNAVYLQSEIVWNNTVATGQAIQLTDIRLRPNV